MSCLDLCCDATLSSVPIERFAVGDVCSLGQARSPCHSALVSRLHQVKQKENGVALKCFQRVIHALDALGWEERQLALVQGLLAGNVFDWGAKAVSE